MPDTYANASNQTRLWNVLIHRVALQPASLAVAWDAEGVAVRRILYSASLDVLKLEQAEVFPLLPASSTEPLASMYEALRAISADQAGVDFVESLMDVALVHVYDRYPEAERDDIKAAAVAEISATLPKSWDQVDGEPVSIPAEIASQLAELAE